MTEPELIADKSPNLTIYPTAQEASHQVAQRIASAILLKQQQGLPIVLGLATGNTPIPVYQELVRLHKDEGLSFQNVISFNLDEYFPLDPTHQWSYHRFMNEQLFDHVDIDKANVHIPRGNCDVKSIEGECRSYEEKIASYGGIDVQLLGIGRNGHIGFNEPGSPLDSNTRLIDLHVDTRSDAANDFGSIEIVPFQAITMGIQTIMKSKNIILLAYGEGKAEIIKSALSGEITAEVPASFLQTLNTVEYVLDNRAASLLV